MTKNTYVISLTKRNTLKQNKSIMKRFTFVQIKITSPQKILSWTERSLESGILIGEVKKSV